MSRYLTAIGIALAGVMVFGGGSWAKDQNTMKNYSWTANTSRVDQANPETYRGTQGSSYTNKQNSYTAEEVPLGAIISKRYQ